MSTGVRARARLSPRGLPPGIDRGSAPSLPGSDRGWRPGRGRLKILDTNSQNCFDQDMAEVRGINPAGRDAGCAPRHRNRVEYY